MMNSRGLAVVITVIAALFVVHTPAEAQPPITPFDQWHGTVSGIVDRIVGAAVELESGRAYAYRTDNLAALLATGDDVRLNRDYIQKVTPEGPVLVYVQPATSMRGPAQRRQLLGSSELEQAFAQCRADWPADFVMQRYCMERQEEAFLAIQRRR